MITTNVRNSEIRDGRVWITYENDDGTRTTEPIRSDLHPRDIAWWHAVGVIADGRVDDAPEEARKAFRLYGGTSAILERARRPEAPA